MLVRIFVALLAICATQTAHAAILVTFDSTSIVANQTGFVDVWIESPQSDLLSGFSAYFQLVAPATSNGTLSFAPAADQPNSQTLFGTEYVLSGGTGLVPINYSATF